MEGPFYPSLLQRTVDTDHDLVKIKGQVVAAGGEVVVIRGRVKNALGEPLAGAVVEIWQCDVNGRYLHPADRGRVMRDAGFQGFGSASADTEGAFSFRTIRPVPYPGRTPHIHVKVWHEGREQLTTQLYLAGHPLNQRDFLFRAMSVREQEQVLLHFDNSDEPVAHIDLVV